MGEECRDWFHEETPYVGPMAAVREYSDSKPKGMTHPPQNPRVRRKLLQDLIDYDVMFQGPKWPLPLPEFQRKHVEKPLGKHSYLLATGRHIQKPQGNHALSTRSFLHRKKNFKDGTVRLSAQWWPDSYADTVEEQRKKENVGTVDKTPSPIGKKGGKLKGSSPMTATAPSISISQSAPDLNQQDPMAQTAPLLKFTPSFGSGSDLGSERRASKDQRGAKGLGVPGAPNTGSEKSDSRRPSRQLAKHDLEHSQRSTTGGKDASRGAFGNDQRPKNEQFPPTELEIKNGVECLRSASRLHTAFTADRYRFTADFTLPGPMVLAGAGCPSGGSTGKWSSDASELNMDHNAAMRSVNPSMLPQLPKEAKKKKKKKDDEEVDLGNSGLFQARYKGDKSLKAIKILRRRNFPEEEKEIVNAHIPEELRNVGFMMQDAGLSLGIAKKD